LQWHRRSGILSVDLGMDSITYGKADFPVRDDLPAAHRRAWARLARPGNWWTGAERVAMAAEIRNASGCPLCRERRNSLSPYAVAGEHTRVASLANPVIDVIHRVVTDPGRLTRKWFEQTLAGGLSDAAYVEIIGTIVTVVSIDSFCRGLGVPLHPLPDPVAGEPSRYRPAAARPGKAWVPMLPNGRVAGPEADLWGDMPGGQTGNVIRALSLVPDEVRTLNDLSAAHYLRPREMMNLKQSRRSLDRAQIELIAGRVSALRGCFY